MFYTLPRALACRNPRIRVAVKIENGLGQSSRVFRLDASASTGPVKRPKPRAENATTQVLMVRMRMIRSKAASSEGGTGRESSITWPRTSSFSIGHDYGRPR